MLKDSAEIHEHVIKFTLNAQNFSTRAEISARHFLDNDDNDVDDGDDDEEESSISRNAFA